MSNDVLNWAKLVTAGGQTRKAVLLLLADYADEKGRAWPSQETVAAVLEMGERTVRAAIKDLIEAGIITRKPRWRPDGTRGTDVLKFDMDLVNRREVPVNLQAATEAKSTGKSRQINRQERPNQPAADAANPLQGEPPQEIPQKQNGSEPNGSGRSAIAKLPIELSIKDRLWFEGKPALIESGLTEKLAGDMIGQWIGRYRDHGRILAAIITARAEGTERPIQLVVAILEGPDGRARASPTKGRRSGMVSIALSETGSFH